MQTLYKLVGNGTLLLLSQLYILNKNIILQDNELNYSSN